MQCEKAEKISDIALADTVEDPWTMMVELGNAVITHAAVFGTRRFDEMTSGAFVIAWKQQLVGCILLHHKLVVVSRDDAGITQAANTPYYKADLEEQNRERFEQRVNKGMTIGDKRPPVDEKNGKSSEHKGQIKQWKQRIFFVNTVVNAGGCAIEETLAEDAAKKRPYGWMKWGAHGKRDLVVQPSDDA